MNQGWIQTSTGKQFFPLAPRVEDIDIEDIAHHLSHINRFTGATKRPYSVAQHSVLVSGIVPLADMLWGLLHDASEAYLNDISRPVKHGAALDGYRLAEDQLQRLICERFGLSQEMPPSVKHADLRMFATEARDLMPGLPAGCCDERRDRELCYPWTIVPWGPTTAKNEFLERYRDLRRMYPHQARQAVR